MKHYFFFIYYAFMLHLLLGKFVMTKFPNVTLTIGEICHVKFPQLSDMTNFPYWGNLAWGKLLGNLV